MHTIFYKDLFDKETQRRSKEFEKTEVKKRFESIGWNYFTNPTEGKVSHIKIDGIATSNRELVVIECKGWRLIRPFFEYEKIQEYLVRDLEGIVDGKKYTKEVLKEIPSFLEIISFVKEKGEVLGFNPNDYDNIKGIIIMRGFPPINKYREISIISIKEIK